MCALRSSSLVFTESRIALKPVKSNSKSNTCENVKRDMLLRTKKLSLDSDSFMKSLQGKYEHKEPKPPPVLGLGVRRYKGSKSSLGRDATIDQEDVVTTINCVQKTDATRKKSLTNGHAESSLQKISEENCIENTTADGRSDIEYVYQDILEGEKDDQEEVDSRLQEVESEVERLMNELADDDLDLDSTSGSDTDSGTTIEHDAASDGDVVALKRLLKQGCDVNLVNQEGSTLLELACDNGHTLAVRILAKCGEVY